MTAPDAPRPAANVTDILAALLHARHVEEFDFMKGDRWSDPVGVAECGNCQRWAKYAHEAGIGPVAEAERRGAERVAKAIGNTPLPATDEARSEEFLAGVLWARDIAAAEQASQP